MLLSEFGYDQPAVGMAVNVDAVANVIGKKYKPEMTPPDVLIFIGEGNEAEAVRRAEVLREKGLCVEFALDVDDVKGYADARKIHKVITLTGDTAEEVEL